MEAHPPYRLPEGARPLWTPPAAPGHAKKGWGRPLDPCQWAAHSGLPLCGPRTYEEGLGDTPRPLPMWLCPAGLLLQHRGSAKHCHSLHRVIASAAKQSGAVAARCTSASGSLVSKVARTIPLAPFLEGRGKKRKVVYGGTSSIPPARGGAPPLDSPCSTGACKEGLGDTPRPLPKGCAPSGLPYSGGGRAY